MPAVMSSCSGAIERRTELVVRATGEQAWLAVPVVMVVILASQARGIVKECLAHRREMWKLRAAERRHQENVERRRQRPVERKRASKGSKP